MALLKCFAPSKKNLPMLFHLPGLSLKIKMQNHSKWPIRENFQPLKFSKLTDDRVASLAVHSTVPLH